MADSEQLEILQRHGVCGWNEWRNENHARRVDLNRADLRGASLSRVNFSGANLREAQLLDADLSSANLTRADLSEAALYRANLYSANLAKAKLIKAELGQANLSLTKLHRADLRDALLLLVNLRGADLRSADLTSAVFYEVVLGNTLLSETRGLDTILHQGPSTIDHRTLERSPGLPDEFLRGCGLPDTVIENFSVMLNRPIEYCSLFISYSSKDQKFAERLYADLQKRGVRCWFAPHDMPIGEDILDIIDQQIRVRDKILLILSEDSVSSDWVKDEVTTGFEEERKRKPKRVLFPVRIDGSVMATPEPWAAKLRARHIGDFTNWKDHDAYREAFERLLRDLKKETGASE